MHHIQTPSDIVAYCQGLLSAPWRFTIVYLSRWVGISHDQLTRRLQGKYNWKGLLKLFLSNKRLSSGYLVIDETEVDKSFARKIQGLGWLFSHRRNKYIFGLHVVVLVWTDGEETIPLGWKIYEKGGGKTKIELAMELIWYGLFVLRIQPKAFIFDSFYASEKILKYLIRYKQQFHSQLPKNRLFNHQQISSVNNGRPYWTETGVIKGNIRVQVVRNRKKFYVTNELGIKRKEQLARYKLRWKIEEVFRFVKSELGLEKCQVRSLQGQNNHIGSCLFLYSTLQDMAAKTQMTVYALKEKATLDVDFVSQTDLSAYMSFA